MLPSKDHKVRGASDPDVLICTCGCIFSAIGERIRMCRDCLALGGDIRCFVESAPVCSDACEYYQSIEHIDQPYRAIMARHIEGGVWITITEHKPVRLDGEKLPIYNPRIHRYSHGMQFAEGEIDAFFGLFGN